MSRMDPFSARASLGDGLPDLYRLDALADRIDLASAPVTVKILLENLLRHAGGGVVTEADVTTLAAWRAGRPVEAEIPFMPSRVVLQDFTGVPAIVDLAVMRDAMADLGGDPSARSATTVARYSRLTWCTMPVPGGTTRRSRKAVWAQRSSW